MSEENKAVVRGALAAINAGDLDALAAAIADDVVEHDVVPGMPPTKAGVIQFFTDLRASFPDLELRNDDIFSEGEKVTARSTINGTHKGEFMGMPATGNQISVPLADYFRFENGKIAERVIPRHRLAQEPTDNGKGDDGNRYRQDERACSRRHGCCLMPALARFQPL